MKLAFSTLGCPQWPIETILRCAVENGFDAVELRGIENEMHLERTAAFSAARRERTLAAFRENHVALCVLGSSASFHDPQSVQAHCAEAMDEIDLCAQLGIRYLRVFGDHIGSGDEKATLRQIAGAIRRLCAHAQGKQVDVLLEVHGDVNTIERLTDVIGQVNSSHFGIIWDVEHSDTVYGREIEPFYRALKPWIRHVHIKDARRLENGERQLCAVGEGDIPLRDIIQMLLEDGYDGFFSLEWEKKWHPELEEPERVFPAYARWMKNICTDELGRSR